MTQTPLTVLVTFQITQGRNDDFLSVLLPHLRRVQAEPTCISMLVHQDLEDPSRFMLFEQWQDRDEFLQVQMHRDYRTPYNEALNGLEAEMRGVSLWQEIALDGSPGSSEPSAGGPPR